MDGSKKHCKLTIQSSRNEKERPPNKPTSKFWITIVGYGRYGNRIVGPKYAHDNDLFDVNSIVDPVVAQNKELFYQSVLGVAKPNTCIFYDFRDWYENYFSQLTPEERTNNVCIDIAIPPHVLHNTVQKYIGCGVKYVILPKPVAVNTVELQSLCHLVWSHDVVTAVASQWNYSSFINALREVLDSLEISTNKKTNGIKYVCIEFSKEDGSEYFTHPPLLEMPHCLQILSSCGLLEHVTGRFVSGSRDCVEVHYDHQHITAGIDMISNLVLEKSADATGDCFKNLGCGLQKRTLEIFLQDDDLNDEPSIFVDFWIKFDKWGAKTLRDGSFRFRGVNLPSNIPEKGTLKEDQLKGMVTKIYDAFAKKRNEDQKSVHARSITCKDRSCIKEEKMTSAVKMLAPVLTLFDYKPVGAEVAQINELWRKVARIQ